MIQGRTERGIEIARRVLESESLREPTHRALMRLLAANDPYTHGYSCIKTSLYANGYSKRCVRRGCRIRIRLLLSLRLASHHTHRQKAL